jgi:hypothetical protein
VYRIGNGADEGGETKWIRSISCVRTYAHVGGGARALTLKLCLVPEPLLHNIWYVEDYKMWLSHSQEADDSVRFLLQTTTIATGLQQLQPPIYELDPCHASKSVCDYPA